jgi:hypothetical protein
MRRQVEVETKEDQIIKFWLTFVCYLSLTRMLNKPVSGLPRNIRKA